MYMNTWQFRNILYSLAISGTQIGGISFQGISPQTMAKHMVRLRTSMVGS